MDLTRRASEARNGKSKSELVRGERARCRIGGVHDVSKCNFCRDYNCSNEFDLSRNETLESWTWNSPILEKQTYKRTKDRVLQKPIRCGLVGAFLSWVPGDSYKHLKLTPTDYEQRGFYDVIRTFYFPEPNITAKILTIRVNNRFVYENAVRVTFKFSTRPTKIIFRPWNFYNKMKVTTTTLHQNWTCPNPTRAQICLTKVHHPFCSK